MYLPEANDETVLRLYSGCLCVTKRVMTQIRPQVILLYLFFIYFINMVKVPAKYTIGASSSSFPPIRKYYHFRSITSCCNLQFNKRLQYMKYYIHNNNMLDMHPRLAAEVCSARRF